MEKGGFTNRTRIRQPDGRVMWLTVPVEKGRPINQTRVVQDGWQRRHRQAMAQTYGLMFRYSDEPLLADLLAPLTEHLCREFRIRTPMVTSTGLGGDDLGRKSELVLNLCREVGATEYLSGPHGRDYLDLSAFEDAGIRVVYHDFPVVQPVLSAADHLFGKDRVWPQAELTSAR